MPRDIDILIADGATSRIGKAVLKSLRRRGLSCEAIDDRQVLKDAPGYLRLLRATLGEVSPKMLMPIFRGELIAGNRSMVPASTVLPLSDAGIIHLLDDKAGASALCTELGIPQPRLYLDSDFIREPADTVTMQRSLVFKRSTGLGGDSVYFPKDGKALGHLIRSCNGRPHLIMDYIDGYDVSVDAIRWDGWFQAVAYRTMVPKVKGTSLVRIGLEAPELVSYARKILDATGYRGVCGVDFRIDRKTGKAFFLECNPRFSGGIRSDLAAGFDTPFLIWQLGNGVPVGRVRTLSHRLSIEWADLLNLRRYM